MLRRRFPRARRPYLSPWGRPGAIIAAVICVFIFFGFLLNPTYLPAILAIIVVYAVMLAAFWFWGRHRLVLSPEEEYAMSGGLDVVDLDDLVAGAEGEGRPEPGAVSGTD